MSVTASAAIPSTTTATATTTTATTATTASSSSAGAASHQWASTHRHRKPAPRCRPLRSAANQDAAEKIASVADLQAQYYTEKLAMKRQQHELLLLEHTKRMRVLDLQEKLAATKLEKIEE